MSIIRKFRPITPGRRHGNTIVHKDTITKSTPEKSLTVRIKNNSGRNNQGKITVRHRGGGHKKLYRIVDFKRNKMDIVGKVAAIEYDPNRTALIALIHYIDGEKRYIIAPKDLKVGASIISSEKCDIEIGNHTKLVNIPEGTFIHNIELKPLKGGQLVRSAGAYAQVLGFDESKKFIIVRLSSGEIRKVPSNCFATIGVIGNESYNLVKLGKAGRTRHIGIRPTVRGSAMNPNDHPHGGGEGKAGIGRPSPLTPWGKKALGLKTRKRNNPSNKYIVRRRSK